MTIEHPPIINPPVDNLTPAEEKAFALLKIEHKKAAIKIDDFQEVEGYGKERVKKDKERVERKKREIMEFGNQPTRKAKLLEMVLTDQIELSNWFGQNTYTLIPCEYDDLFHGVDLALEIDDDNETNHLALNIDVTTSPATIRSKLKIIKAHILDGTLSAMEYFHSEAHNPHFYGTMRNIPQVVIGADGRTIRELEELWMSAYGLAKLKKESPQPPLSPEAEESQRQKIKETKEKLGQHRAQFLLLEQIKIQLTTYRDFALRKNKTGVAASLNDALELINLILQEKEGLDPDGTMTNNNDRVFQALKDALQEFDSL